MIRHAYIQGCNAARMKFALGPPTEVDQFMANVENGKDVMPPSAQPPMEGAPGEMPPALDGTTPLQMPSQQPPMPPPMPPPMAGAPGEPPPPNMGMLGG